MAYRHVLAWCPCQGCDISTLAWCPCLAGPGRAASRGSSEAGGCNIYLSVYPFEAGALARHAPVPEGLGAGGCWSPDAALPGPWPELACYVADKDALITRGGADLIPT